MATRERLRKSSRDRVLFGVAGGLAEYFNVDSTLVRVAFIITTFTASMGLLVYLSLALLMPGEASATRRPGEVLQENLETMGQEAAEAARQVGSTVHGAPFTPGQEERRRMGLGLILIILGVLFLLSNFGMLEWFHWGKMWPLALVVLGIAMIIGRLRRT